MTIPRVNELRSYFTEIPPVHISAARLMAGVVGMPGKPKSDDEAMGEFISMFGANK